MEKAKIFSGSRSLRSSKKIPPSPRVSPRCLRGVRARQSFLRALQLCLVAALSRPRCGNRAHATVHTPSYTRYRTWRSVMCSGWPVQVARPGLAHAGPRAVLAAPLWCACSGQCGPGLYMVHTAALGSSCWEACTWCVCHLPCISILYQTNTPSPLVCIPALARMTYVCSKHYLVGPK